jgi:hypothetical protein
MKRYALAAATALTVVFAGQALAQQVSVEIAPETRTTIKEYVVKEKVKPITIKDKLAVGATLPTEVALVPAPQAWGTSVSKYHYVYHDNRVVLVEPASRKVVQIID